MPLARTHSAALTGAEGHLVSVEAGITNGLPATIVTGLPDTALREARDRVRAAILNSGRDWPRRKITISLSPANLPGHGSGLDLAIAVALLAADGAFPAEAPKGIMFLAELGLDGRLRPVPGVLPAVATAAADRMTTVVVAPENKAEAEQAGRFRVVSAENLAQVIEWFRGGPAPASPTGTHSPPAHGRPEPDFVHDACPAHARLAAEACAAGGHSLSIVGRAGAGKRMLAERLPAILPDLSERDAFEVTSVYSAAGQLPWEHERITRPPFVHPHHTCSVAAMLGGGPLTRPGAVSLAHRGVLLLDNAPEFSREVLDALHQPIETGQVTIKRADSTVTFPARFQLVLTAAACPCGAPDDRACGCTPAARRRYLGRLAGPLADRVEVKVRLEPAAPAEVRKPRRPAESSEVVAERVAAARERSARRLEGTPWRLNAEIPCRELRRSYAPRAGAMSEIEHAMELGKLSTRGADKVLGVAWTVSDLAGQDRPGTDEVHTALQLFLGE